MSEQNWDDDVDLLVLGTGAGGLAAAVTGAAEGRTTLVLEKTEFVGIPGRRVPDRCRAHVRARRRPARRRSGF
jgi:flavin-dependent dehydrogenase